MSRPSQVIPSTRHGEGAEKRRCKKKTVDKRMNKWAFMERASDVPGHSIRGLLQSPRGLKSLVVTDGHHWGDVSSGSAG